MVEIIYKDKDLIAVKKPVGVPSQSDLSGDKNLMTETSKMLFEQKENPALWLVHRLDRNVGGVIIFARTKNMAAELSRIIAEGNLSKKYFAVCEGSCSGGEYRDYLFKDSATSKAYVVKTERRGAKEACLIAEPIAEAEGKTLLRIELKTGRFHQIRAQLSSRGHSLVGDKKYGSRDTVSKTPALFSAQVAVSLSNKRLKLTALPDLDKYPWSLFDKETYKL